MQWSYIAKTNLMIKSYDNLKSWNKNVPIVFQFPNALMV
jgi:hypothetical protein